MAKQPVSEVIALLDKMRKIARQARKAARDKKATTDCCERVAPYFQQIDTLNKEFYFANDGIDWTS
jgi:hypothetical protein